MTTKWKEHQEAWINCKRCPLWEKRNRVVLVRGRIPCQVLFIGEAPGASEDVLGKPFVGPAGQLLDAIIRDAWDMAGSDASYALTNLVACIPKGDDGNKIHEPPKESIESCAPRVLEFIRICKPVLIVCVGSLATKWVPKIVEVDEWFRDTVRLDIIHPAAILRADITQKGLAIQRAVVTLADQLVEL